MNKRIKSIILIILIGLTLIGCNSAYIVNFDSMGGTEVSTIDVQKGSTISIPSVTREGYTLVGWYTSLNDGETLDEKWSFTSNTISNDITLYAKWIINEYTITFDSNGGNNINSITQDYDTTVNESAEPTRGGYTFGGWYSDDELTITYSFTAITAEDIILYAKWTINQYTITFDSNEGASILSITQDYDTTVNGTTESTRGGYTFGGWYSDEELTITYTFTTMPAEDITLYAKWDTITYDITYQLGGGINGNNPDIYTAETNTIILNVLTKENYTFEGWFNNAEFTGDAVTEITLGSTGDMTLYAKWTVNQYTITYATGINVNGLVPLLHQGEIITQISLGSWHSLAITSTGRVFTWGNNGYGQLGDGTINNSPPRSTLTEITTQFNLSDGETIIQISLGDYHSSAITSTGRVFTWGSNEYGQLGDGTTTDRYTPTAITSQFNLVEGETITQIYLGGTHSSAITSEGRVFTWGNNIAGQLGDGTNGIGNFNPTPTEITSQFNLSEGETITQISLGGFWGGGHSSVITSEGRVFTWGSNEYGQLGDGTTTNRSTPTEITSQFNLSEEETITQISLGTWHSSAITSTGRVFTWGFNGHGQLGDGTSGNGNPTPTEITSQFYLVEGETITQIYLGGTHSSAITSEGRVFTWGRNDFGELGDGTTTNRFTPTEIISKFNLNEGETITQISLGGSEFGGHSSVITSEGRVFTWGRNDSGQLGDGTTTNRYTPKFLSIYTIINVEIYDFDEGTNEYIPSMIGYIFSGWYSDQELTIPYLFTTMPSENIVLYGEWNIITYNITYQLVDGINGNNPDTYTVDTGTITLDEPIKEGYTYSGWFDNEELTGEAITEITLGTTGDITLYTKWTVNQYTITYAIGTNVNANDLMPLLHQGEIITQITFGGGHSSAITSLGRIFTWGRNDSGQLGDGTTTNRSTPTEITSQFNLSEGETITQISLGFYHSSAITSLGRIFTWGRNSNRQLGDGTTTDRYIPTEITSQFNLSEGETITQISLGESHSSAITSEGRVFTWGRNDSGQLGDGTTTGRYTPIEITSQFNLSEGETITQISLNWYQSSAITSSGRLFTWGNNYYGQLGDGTTSEYKVPNSTPIEITSQFNLSEGETITQISLGCYHSSAITSSGRLFTWGYNEYGLLGDGTTTDRYTPTEITSQFNLSEGETITQISLDGTHSSAITSEGRVFTWGRNDSGQLGDGTHDYFVAHSTPIEITNQFELNAGEIIIQIFLGGGASSAIASSGRIFTWGDNTEGQLGDGTTTDRYTPKFLSIYTRINGEIYDFNEDTTEYIPSMIGYTFSGWYSDQELTIPYIFTTMPAENITLYAKREIDLLENIDKDYYVTGQFNGFDTVLSGLMTAISICDGRISSIQTDLEGVKYLYIAEVTFLDTDAGWTVAYTIDGTDYILNGNLTVRIIRTIIGDSDTRDWWAQSPESGAITNLTSDTLYIPPFVEEDIDQAGTWNDNLVVYIAGTYYAVFAEFADGTRGLALIPVE